MVRDTTVRDLALIINKYFHRNGFKRDNETQYHIVNVHL